MVYCLLADLAFSTAARRDAVLADVQAQAAQHATWGTSMILSTTWVTGQPAVTIDMRFTSVVSQQAMVNRIEQFATGQRTPISGSWYEFHPCTHDQDPPQPCVTGTRRVW